MMEHESRNWLDGASAVEAEAPVRTGVEATARGWLRGWVRDTPGNEVADRATEVSVKDGSSRREVGRGPGKALSSERWEKEFIWIRGCQVEALGAWRQRLKA